MIVFFLFMISNISPHPELSSWLRHCLSIKTRSLLYSPLHFQGPQIHTTIDDAFSSVLQYMSVTSRQCRVSYDSDDNFGSTSVV